MSSIKHLFPLSRSIVRVGSMLSVHKQTIVKISTSMRNYDSETTRKVQEHEDGDTLIVEAVVTDNVSYAGRTYTSQGACPICSRNLQVSYKDVLILDQFVSGKSGKILAQRITGVCTKQHRILEDCIDKAQKAGLLPPPDLSDVQRPPESMHLPRGSFNVFYRSNMKGVKRRD